MYRLLSTAALFLVFAFEAFAQGTVIDTSFFSPALGQEKSVQVYLPDGYGSRGCQRYPVIYYLHGAGSLLGHDEFPELVAVLDEMIAGCEIKPVILVKPYGFSSPYPASFYTSSILYGDLEGYMTEDLVAWMDSNFRTIPSHRKRAVMGHSMGGYGAIMFYGKHPDLYCCAAAVCGSGLDLPTMLAINIYGILAELGGVPPYIYNPSAGFANGVLFSMSGAFSPDLTNPPYYVDLPIDEYAGIVPEVWSLWMEHNLPQYLQLMADACGGDHASIYFDAGTLDQFYIVPASNAFADSLDAMGIDYEYQIFEGGHFDKLSERFPIAINFLCNEMHHSWGWSDFEDESAMLPDPGSVFGFHSAVGGDCGGSSLITFDLYVPGNVALDIYDGAGRIVETVFHGPMDAGLHTVDMDCAGLASGVYFYSIRSHGETAAGKILLMR